MECDFSFRRNEITRVFLQLLLELPPLRQSDSHTKLMEKFTTIPPEFQFANEIGLSKELFLCISELVVLCQSKRKSAIEGILDRLFEFKNLTTEQFLLLEEMNKKM